MSRPLRVQRPDAWYHITGRGTERWVIFRRDRDYQHWLELIVELTDRFRLQVMAYAMMPNHYHLIVAAPQMNLSRAMQWFQTSYSPSPVPGQAGKACAIKTTYGHHEFSQRAVAGNHRMDG